MTPFPRELCNDSSKKATSRLADGMERAETIGPEVAGADWPLCGVMADAVEGGCRCLLIG